MIRGDSVAPEFLRLQIIRILDDNGLDEVPFEPSFIHAVFFLGIAAAENFGLQLGNNAHCPCTLACTAMKLSGIG